MPPMWLCQEISLCRQVLEKELRQKLPASSGQGNLEFPHGSTNSTTGMGCVPKPDIDEDVSNHEKNKLFVFLKLLLVKKMLGNILSRRTTLHLYQDIYFLNLS